MKSYYQVIGVDSDATFPEIEHAYRQRLLELTTRLQGEAEGTARHHEIDFEIQALLDAHAVVADLRKRVEYDKKIAPRDRDDFQMAPERTLFSFATLASLLTRPAILILILSMGGFYLMNRGSEQNTTPETIAEENGFSNRNRGGELAVGMEMIGATLQAQQEMARRRLELQQQQLELEQNMMQREMEYGTFSQRETVDLNRRQQEFYEQGVSADRAYRQELRSDDRLQRRLKEIEQATAEIKETNAARLGLSRSDYDRLQAEKLGASPIGSDSSSAADKAKADYFTEKRERLQQQDQAQCKRSRSRLESAKQEARRPYTDLALRQQRKDSVERYQIEVEQYCP
ncbi:MAG: hypothetical protein HQL48_02085 [Gammaproteobacteria bacterium]|nr:hypothetical protein [Gammaproteobacteria bacterium]